jgi:hypothetical protein
MGSQAALGHATTTLRVFRTAQEVIMYSRRSSTISKFNVQLSQFREATNRFHALLISSRTV